MTPRAAATSTLLEVSCAPKAQLSVTAKTATIPLPISGTQQCTQHAQTLCHVFSYLCPPFLPGLRVPEAGPENCLSNRHEAGLGIGMHVSHFSSLEG